MERIAGRETEENSLSEIEKDNRIIESDNRDERDAAKGAAADASAELAAIEKEIEALKATTAKRVAVRNLKRAVTFAKWRVMLGVLLVAVAGTSFMTLRDATAWFSINQTVNSDGSRVETEAADAEADYYVYIHEAKAGAVLYTGDDHDDFDDPTLETLDMQFHDMIFKERNRYTPAIVRIELRNIKSTYANGGTVTLTICRDTTLPNDRMNDFFTTVMRFTLFQNSSWYSSAVSQSESNPAKSFGDALYFLIDEAPYTTSPLVTIYDHYKQPNLTNTTGSKVFTSVSGNVVTKADAIEISCDYTAADIVDGILNVYLYITYDQTLLSTYQGKNGITGGETIGRTVLMDDDIDSMTVSFSAPTP